MSEAVQPRSADPTEHRHTMKRRGLIAGAAALAAGLMSKQAAQPVLAAAAMNYANTTTTVTNGPVQGQTNLSGAVPSGQTMFNVDASATVGSATAIVGRGAGTLSGLFGYGGTNLGAGVVGVEGGGVSPGGSLGAGVYGTSDSNVGVYGKSTSSNGVHAISTHGVGVSAESTTAYAVSGTSGSSYGIVGATNATAGFGVAGVYGSGSADGNYGVIGDGGDSASTGVLGRRAQCGVVGTTADSSTFPPYNPADSIAVLGDNRSARNNGIGVQGIAQSGGAATGTVGVYGANLNTAPSSHGIIGLSQGGHGLVGTCNAHPSGGNTYAGLVGLAGVSDANAGNFYGNVAITGTLNGHTAIIQHAQVAVAHPDGTHRLAYSVASTESMLEEFGKGTLAYGQATIKIDPAFAALADMSDYHVFLTAYGDHRTMYIGKQTAEGFEVRTKIEEISAGPAGATQTSGKFGYRIVAKRRDVTANRLATYTPPKLDPPKIALPTVPDWPTPPPPKKP